MADEYTYKRYFDIDPEFFPVVNEGVIAENPDLWKKYYPHDTFVQLIRTTVDVLESKKKLSMWVEGAYGTGKSHAVLTLKKLLDADEADVREYFDRFDLDRDLFNRLQSAKSGRRVLTVHRYGSSSILSDQSLVFAVQESIDHALNEAGIENKAGSALRGAAVNWISDGVNKSYFSSLISGPYATLFGGDTADGILEKLQTYEGDALNMLMEKIFRVAEERQIRALSMSTTDLSKWIKEVIRANELKAIVFIWDEFTEYFKNNARRLTGFQELCEISMTDPFYFVLVTHLSAALFHDKDDDSKKINDRFVRPHNKIELPENIAFQLLGYAMEKKKDPDVLNEWQDTVDDLADRTRDSRKLVKAAARITDAELQGVLPIHPYAALLLKHIAVAYASDERSMFEFIKNDTGEDLHGFQWFISTASPEDENPLLTIDELWDFFYENGKDLLTREVKQVLDYFGRPGNSKLNPEERRVLKTVLLLQAISQSTGDDVDLFIPDAKNLTNAFEGTDLSNAAVRCADALVRNKVLYTRKIGADRYQYCAYQGGDDIDILPFEEKIDRMPVNQFVSMELSDGISIAAALNPTGASRLRFDFSFCGVNDFESELRKIISRAASLGNQIPMLVCFAKDGKEATALEKKIRAAAEAPDCTVVFVDATSVSFENAGYKQFREDYAYSMAYTGKDNAQSAQYLNNAKEILKAWRKAILEGQFRVYYAEKQDGELCAKQDKLAEELSSVNALRYPQSPEVIFSNVHDTMFQATSMKVGVECGVAQTTKGTFSNNKRLEKALEGVWGVEKYWEERPNLAVSRMKIEVDKLIADAFEKDGRISIRDIYDFLCDAPYGFRPCNLTAFLMGFLLKEYTVDGIYSYYDNVTSVPMDVSKLKDMVNDVINLQITPSPKYKDKYIVSMDEREKAFNALSSVAFGIPQGYCTSVAATRQQIRAKMKELGFPIWTLKSLPALAEETKLNGILCEMIDLFGGIANTNNLGAGRSENDIAIELGQLHMDNSGVDAALKGLLTKDNCTSGMAEYLKTFEEGALPRLAAEIEDGGQYINVLRKKFSADAANWVWNEETVQQKIREVILEYSIIAESNNVLTRNVSFDGTIHDWCDKCGYIRVAFSVAKSSLNELAPFMDMLYKMKRAGGLAENQKEEFLRLLQLNSENFRSFMSNQAGLFKQVCASYLEDLSDEEIAEVYGTMPSNSFTMDKSEYLKTVDDRVNAYREGILRTKLAKLWKEKTGTANPRDWSKKHKMPLLCLVPESEIQAARAAFDTVNKSKPDNASVEKALEYLETAAFFADMDNSDALDRAFRERIVKNYAVILTDMDEVRDHLASHVSAEPYEWIGLTEVDKKIQTMAEKQYYKDGCDKALEVIDQMDVTDAKRYLKELIRNNMVVGMEIIKDN